MAGKQGHNKSSANQGKFVRTTKGITPPTPADTAKPVLGTYQSPAAQKNRKYFDQIASWQKARSEQPVTILGEEKSTKTDSAAKIHLVKYNNATHIVKCCCDWDQHSDDTSFCTPRNTSHGPAELEMKSRKAVETVRGGYHSYGIRAYREIGPYVTEKYGEQLCPGCLEGMRENNRV